MTRRVKCTVTNTTSHSLDYDSKHLSHGKSRHSAETVPANTTDFRAFEFEKDDVFNGVTGHVNYNLADGSKLIFMFNNPYTHSGSGYTGNMWFYACIQPPSGKASAYYVEVDKTRIDWQYPESHEKIEATVTLRKS